MNATSFHRNHAKDKFCFNIIRMFKQYGQKKIECVRSVQYPDLDT